MSNKNSDLSKSKPLLFIFISILFLSLKIISSTYENPISNVNVKIWQNHPYTKSKEITLPHRFEGINNSIVNYEMGFDSEINDELTFRFIPDDCLHSLKINEKNINIKSINGKCDYNVGFELIIDSLKPKANIAKISVRNGGGIGGLSIEATNKGMGHYGKLFLGTLFLIIALKGIFTFIPLWVIIPGLVLRILYTIFIPINKYGYDWQGHGEYLQAIVNNNLPNVDSCWQCYHPPGYYFISSWFTKLMGMNTENYFRYGSFLNFSYSILLMILGCYVIKIIGQNFQSKYHEYITENTISLAQLMLAVLPSYVIFTQKLGNDALLLVSVLGWVIFSFKWLTLRKQQYLHLSTITLILGLWTKSTSVILVAASFILWLEWGYHSVIKNKNWNSFFKTIGPGVFISISGLLLLLFVQNIRGSEFSLVANSAALNSQLVVGSSWENFFGFGITHWLQSPFISAWDDEFGRQYFWVYLLKSSLFGEFRFNSIWAIWGASIQLIWLICSLPIITSGWYLLKLKPKLLLLVLFILSIGAMISLRIKHPFACSSDFRYISFLWPLMIAVLVGGFRSKPSLFKISAFVFIVSSCLFWFGLFIGS